MLITIIILVLSAVFFVNGKVRSDIVALCALIALLIFQILTPDEALSGFSNSVVIMMIGLFVVGGAIFQTGLAKMISSRILKLAGTSEIRQKSTYFVSQGSAEYRLKSSYLPYYLQKPTASTACSDSYRHSLPD